MVNKPDKTEQTLYKLTKMKNHWSTNSKNKQTQETYKHDKNEQS